MDGNLIFDIETNGLLPDLTKVHCLAYRDEAGGVIKSVGGKTDEKIRDFLTHLEASPRLIGHSILDFDIPALKKVYPNFAPKGEVWDTVLDSQIIWSNMRDLDFGLARKNPDFPKKLIGRHSLKSWGYRLGVLKGTFAEDGEDGVDVWANWTQEMQDYCEQDVKVTALLYEKIKTNKRFSQRAHDMEMEFKQYMLDQENEGFPFDEVAAKALYAELAAQRAELEAKITGTFAPWVESLDFTPKRDNKTRGYVKGVPYKKTKTVEFNPRSHKHIYERLIAQRGWVPEEFTEAGAPSTDDDVLESLAKKWPECSLLAEHAKIQKIIGMVAEGRSAYLKKTVNGRIHGRVKTCGTVTGRCAHNEPNLGNIPRKGVLGLRVRGLFTSTPGYRLVGCDAKGLELRMLAHFLARFDGGKYGKIVVEGDPHAYHQGLAGLESRDDAKTFIYGFIYGAGDGKIGLIIHKGKAAGRTLRLKFLKNFPALNYLKQAVAGKAQQTNYITGLDGRQLYVRAVYSSLNTLLQSAGALVMKQAVVIFNRRIRELGLYQSGAVRQVAFVHDEIQSLVREDHVSDIQSIAVDAIRDAGTHFGLRCQTDAEAKAGGNWGETH